MVDQFFFVASSLNLLRTYVEAKARVKWEKLTKATSA